MKYDVLSVGSPRMDVFVRLPDVEVESLCSIDKKKCVIELGFGDKIAVRGVEFAVGGNAGNNAVGLSRLGYKSAIVGSVGDQAVDEQVLQSLREEGVGVKYLRRTKGLGGYGVVINYQAERTILSYYGQASESFLDDGEQVEATWVYLTTVGSNYEKMYQQALGWAAHRRTKIAFNPGSRQVQEGDKLKYVYERADIVFANREEAALVLGADVSDVRALLSGLHQWGSKVVVITDGSAGSYAFDGNEMLFMPIAPAQVIERTGAGDAFGAGFMGAVLAGKSTAEALRWGTMNSASKLGFVGPQRGLLTYEEMQLWLSKYEDVKVEKL